MLSRNCDASTSLYTILRSLSLRPFTLKCIDTSLNLATCAAISSLMFSFKRHLSAVLGGGAARRPAWAKSITGRTIAKISANSQRSVFIGKILAAWGHSAGGHEKSTTEARRHGEKQVRTSRLIIHGPDVSWGCRFVANRREHANHCQKICWT